MGNYHVHQQYHGVIAIQAIPDNEVYPPHEIIKRVKDNLTGKSIKKERDSDIIEITTKQLSQKERAHNLVLKNKISFDPNLRTFTVLGSEDKPQAVKSFPTQSCTCPSTTVCYHNILAEKMVIGMEVTASKKKINLTQLHKNAWSRQTKESSTW